MLKDVLKRYNIKFDGIVNKVNTSHVSNVWKIINNSNNYILKEYSLDNLERIQFLLNLNRRLYEYSPRIYKNKNDDFFVIYNNHIYVLYEFEKGIHLKREEINEKQCFKLGEFLR